MSKLIVKIDYRLASTIISGIKTNAEKNHIKNLLKWLDELKDILDKAAIEGKEEN